MKSCLKYCVASIHLNSLGEASVGYYAYQKGPYGKHLTENVKDEYVLWYDTKEEAQTHIMNSEGECVISMRTDYIPKFGGK